MPRVVLSLEGAVSNEVSGTNRFLMSQEGRPRSGFRVPPRTVRTRNAHRTLNVEYNPEPETESREPKPNL